MEYKVVLGDTSRTIVGTVEPTDRPGKHRYTSALTVVKYTTVIFGGPLELS